MPLFRLVGNILWRVPYWLIATLYRRSRPRSRRWVKLELGDMVEPVALRRSRFSSLMPNAPRRASGEGLARLVRALQRDTDVEGLVVHMPRFRPGWAWAGGVRRLFAQLVDSGKRVVVFLPEGGADRELYVASAASTVVTTPRASLSLFGFAAGGVYVSEVLARIGIQAQVSAQGDYKTAAERFVEPRMSESEREQLSAVLGQRQDLLSEALIPRSGSRQRVDRLFERVVFSAAAAIEHGLVDHASYEDGLAPMLGFSERPKGLRPLAARAYLRRVEAGPWRPLRPQPYIAVVPISGIIQRTAGWDRTGAFRQVTPLEATQFTLRRVRKDPHAVAVMLYVDSPGGSALVSDLIHHEVQALAGAKPVVAFFANVAASGGYYVAAPVREIVAAPEAITGSIGVVAVKLVIEQLLDKLGARHEVVKTAPHADILSMARAYDPSEQQLVEAETRAIYEGFLQVVSQGRGRAPEEIAKVAGGRVWSAPDAQRHGLVDSLGDMDAALERARALSDVPARFRARLRPRLCPPVAKPETPEASPSEDAAGWLKRVAPRLSSAPELSLLDLVTSGHERVLCCSLPAMRLSS